MISCGIICHDYPWQGGAISNHIPGQPGSAGPVTVTNSTFSGNSGTDSGGIYNNGTLNVTNSTFSGNRRRRHPQRGRHCHGDQQYLQRQ